MVPPPALTTIVSRRPWSAFTCAKRLVEISMLGRVGPNGGHGTADLGNGGVQPLLAAARDVDVRASAVNFLAVARPMPLVAPVTTAILFSSLLVMIVSIDWTCERVRPRLARAVKVFSSVREVAACSLPCRRPIEVNLCSHWAGEKLAAVESLSMVMDAAVKGVTACRRR